MLRKIIEIREKDIIPLKVLAAKENKNLKQYIQDVLSHTVLDGNEKENGAD